MSWLHAPTMSPAGVLRPTQLEVDLGILGANLEAIQSAVGACPVMPVLKANAYGHGLVEVAVTMVSRGAAHLAVAYLEEGIRLREAGVTVPILVLGGILGSQIPEFLSHDLTLTASSVEKLVAIDDAAGAVGKRGRVHLKIDTGMERIGVHWYSAEPLFEAALRCRHLDVEGVYSHFANADGEDLGSTRVQLERFLEATAFFDRRGVARPLRHIANSAAIVRFPEAHLDLVRPGILLFGILPSAHVPPTIPVRPALTWRSRVVYFKVVRPHHPVSYGSTWSADHPVRVVTVPVGYGDGYMRAMSGSAEVILRGRRHPVVGAICMDQIMVDIEWTSAWNGDEVILLGEADGLSITVEEMARWARTIPYEVLTAINTRVPRIYRGSAASSGVP